MPKATVTFYRLIQDSQDLATQNPNESHMLSKAFFTLKVGSQMYSDMYVVIRQPFGTDYATEPIEVESPVGSYKGNWNHAEFSDFVEKYYRALVGQQGQMIRIGPNVRNIRMRNNIFEIQRVCEIDIPK